MPYCPVCKYEYVEGMAKCPDCGDNLIDGLPSEEEMVSIYVAKDSNEAMIVRGILDEIGIPVAERADKNKDLDIFASPIEEEDIQVPMSHAEEARKILEKALEAGKRLDTIEESEEETNDTDK